jgi:hypothetical protein
MRSAWRAASLSPALGHPGLHEAAVSRVSAAIDATIGAALVAGTAFVLGSWLVFGIAFVPLVVVGFFVPVALAINEHAAAIRA